MGRTATKTKSLASQLEPILKKVEVLEIQNAMLKESSAQMIQMLGYKNSANAKDTLEALKNCIEELKKVEQTKETKEAIVNGSALLQSSSSVSKVVSIS